MPAVREHFQNMLFVGKASFDPTPLPSTLLLPDDSGRGVWTVSAEK
jgi:hypothetical protein